MLLLLPSSFLAIDQAFYTQLLTNAEQKLEVNMYAILSEINIIDGKIEVAGSSLAPDFYRPDSGLSAYITDESQLVWQSDSSLNQHFIPPNNSLPPGEHLFAEVEQHNEEFWVLSIALLFDSEESTHPLTVHVVQTDQRLSAPHISFRTTLARWFIGIAIVLLLLMLLAYYWTTKPLSRLDNEIRRVESGSQDQLNGRYPAELEVIKEDLNLLLANQNRQKQRYRHHLSDLAHSLKTPVAVLQTSVLSQQPELQDQLDRITSMIEHQLKRASSSGQDVWKKQILIKPLLQKLVSALEKIYRDKDLIINIECQDNDVFKGDETDLMEILGNLLDNASKACKSLVSVSIIMHPLTISVEDDGPGIPSDKHHQLFQRGSRLDTYSEGHGVGLAIVAELVESYSGKLSLDTSPYGGARFSIVFPD